MVDCTQLDAGNAAIVHVIGAGVVQGSILIDGLQIRKLGQRLKQRRALTELPLPKGTKVMST